MMKKKNDEISNMNSLSFEEKIKTAYFLMIAALVPLVKLQIVYNTTVFDFINSAFILLFSVVLFTRGKFQMPLLFPMAVILTGSLISMFNSQVPVRNSLALIIDLYLFFFFIVLYNITDTKRDSKVFILFWTATAVFQSGFVLLDILPSFTGRSVGTFLNPNMAASYLGLSFFLLFQPYVRLGKFLTVFLALFILTGLLATKSMAGISGLFIALVATAVIYLYHTKAFQKIRLWSAVAVIIIIIILGTAVFSQISKVPDLLNRFPKASYSRMKLWEEGFDTFIKNPLGTGIGPAGFKYVGPEIKEYNNIIRKKELHNDWLAFLIERGIFGFMGIVLLVGAITRMLIGTFKFSATRRELVWLLGLSGMLIFILSFSLTHEVLHFRHVWCLFALIAVEFKLRKKDQEESPSMVDIK